MSIGAIVVGWREWSTATKVVGCATGLASLAAVAHIASRYLCQPNSSTPNQSTPAIGFNCQRQESNNLGNGNTTETQSPTVNGATGSVLQTPNQLFHSLCETYERGWQEFSGTLHEARANNHTATLMACRQVLSQQPASDYVAQHELALLWLNGEGGPQDLNKARQLFESLSRDCPVHPSLSMLRLLGIGGPKVSADKVIEQMKQAIRRCPNAPTSSFWRIGLAYFLDVGVGGTIGQEPPEDLRVSNEDRTRFSRGIKILCPQPRNKLEQRLQQADSLNEREREALLLMSLYGSEGSCDYRQARALLEQTNNDSRFTVQLQFFDAYHVGE